MVEIKEKMPLRKRTNRLEDTVLDALPGFTFENGYHFAITDLADRGVKIELNHERDGSRAVILPPEKVAECGKWLLNTLGQNRHGLPKDFLEVLKRLGKYKGTIPILERGDKTRIRQAIEVLKKS